MAIITLRKISKTYKGVPLLSGVDAEFTEGRITGVVGHNGSGKSVLFKIICGFVRPDTGSVDIDPSYKREHDRFPRDFGIIIDRPGYLSGRTGLQNLRELAAIRGQVGDKEILATAERLGIATHLHRKVRHYSLGMKQKLALTQAVMEDQRVLLLDEPFNGLDAESVESVRGLLLECRDQGKTVIFTSHQQGDMDVLSDEMYRINQHRLERVSS